MFPCSVILTENEINYFDFSNTSFENTLDFEKKWTKFIGPIFSTEILDQSFDQDGSSKIFQRSSTPCMNFESHICEIYQDSRETSSKNNLCYTCENNFEQTFF